MKLYISIRGAHSSFQYTIANAFHFVLNLKKKKVFKSSQIQIPKKNPLSNSQMPYRNGSHSVQYFVCRLKLQFRNEKYIYIYQIKNQLRGKIGSDER